MLNQVVLEGRLAFEPELQIVKSTGNKVLNNRLAHSVYKGKDTETETLWIGLTAWGNVAQFIAEGGYKKGDRVVVFGKLNHKTNKDGKAEIYLVVEQIRNLTTKSSEAPDVINSELTIEEPYIDLEENFG